MQNFLHKFWSRYRTDTSYGVLKQFRNISCSQSHPIFTGYAILTYGQETSWISPIDIPGNHLKFISEVNYSDRQKLNVKSFKSDDADVDVEESCISNFDSYECKIVPKVLIIRSGDCDWNNNLPLFDIFGGVLIQSFIIKYTQGLL